MISPQACLGVIARPPALSKVEGQAEAIWKILWIKSN